MKTIPRLVRWAAETFADEPALADVEAGVTLGFSQLAERAHAIARAWMALGVARGDRIAIWAPNSWEWVVAALGAHAAGAVLVPINTRWKGREAAFVLRKSRARALVTVNGFLGVDYLAELRAAGPVPELSTIVVTRGSADGALSWAELEARAEDTPSAAAEERALSVDGGDLSDLLFTSGTTGHPKGVECTHEQTLRVFEAWSRLVGLEAGDRYLIVNPFFHTFGYKAGWLACLQRGALALPQAVFDPKVVLARIERERITVLPGPPTLYQTLLDEPERRARDLSSLRLAVTGAAVIPIELVRRVREELGFRYVVTAYGLTECTGVATACRRDDDLETIATTSGCALPGTEVKVVDDAGGERPRGEPGEVWVRGYHVMRGYLDEPAETAAAVGADGWLRTGDIGVMDARGYLRITDRKKDLFIVGGFNAYPAEIEAALCEHPKIARAAVVGAPDPRLGEVGHAFVVLRPGTQATASELISWARDRMAHYKAPRRITFLRELPLNASGKVLKYQLRDQARHFPNAASDS
jgi:acyl-CoA synthetase (AMP-forming)/AMP-acid ligase II